MSNRNCTGRYLCGIEICAYNFDGKTVPCYVSRTHTFKPLRFPTPNSETSNCPPAQAHIDQTSEPSIYDSTARPLIQNSSYLGYPFILHYFATDNVLSDAYLTSHWHLVKSDGTLLEYNPCSFPPSLPPPPAHPPHPSPPEIHDVLHIGLLDGFCGSTPVLGTNVSGNGMIPIMFRPGDDSLTPMFFSHAIHSLKALSTSQSSEVTAAVSIHEPDHVKVGGKFVYTRVFGAIADEWQFLAADGTITECDHRPSEPPLSPPPPAAPPVPSPPPFPPRYDPVSPPPAAPTSFCNYSESMSKGMFSSERCEELKELWFPTHEFFDNSGSNVFGYCLVDSAANQVIVRQEAINYDEIDHLSYICSENPPPQPPATPPAPPSAPICINLLDEMNLDQTCESILGMGKLTCLVGELHDQHLCDKSCGTCVCRTNSNPQTCTYRTSHTL